VATSSHCPPRKGSGGAGTAASERTIGRRNCIGRAAQYSDAGHVYPSSRPTQSRVFVRPDRYGRARSSRFSTGRAAPGSKRTSRRFARGQRFEVRNAQDYFGAPISTGTWSGAPVRPMKALPAAEPVGWKRPPPAGPDLNIFVIVPAGSKSMDGPRGLLDPSLPGHGRLSSAEVAIGPSRTARFRPSGGRLSANLSPRIT
jgi:hypothetical protein